MPSRSIKVICGASWKWKNSSLASARKWSSIRAKKSSRLSSRVWCAVLCRCTRSCASMKWNVSVRRKSAKPAARSAMSCRSRCRCLRSKPLIEWLVWLVGLVVARELAPAGARSGPNPAIRDCPIHRILQFYDCFAAERDGATIRQAPSPQGPKLVQGSGENGVRPSALCNSIRYLRKICPST